VANPKTTPNLPPPKVSHPLPGGDYVRKCDLDAFLGRNFPIPTQIISNEEYIPMSQTPEQRAVEHHLIQMADQNARALGMDRRRFLRTACGMATAFVALNRVFGDFYRVEAAEMLEPAAAAAAKENYFIFDAQTHHVAVGRETPFLMGLRRFGGQLNPQIGGRNPVPEDIYLENYIKEVFLDSETHVAVISGIPALTDAQNILPPDQMVHTRMLINKLAGSQRMVSHGLMVPDLGTRNLETMQVQVESLKIEAWKGYTGIPVAPGVQGWWLDDEKVAYPSLEKSRKLGVKNICLHKGLPLPIFNEEYTHPRDIVKASKDFPNLNFLIYHSGFKSVQDALPAAADGFSKSAYVPWVSDLCEARKKNPHMNNVYMELGSTFGLMTVSNPLLCAHVLGMIIQSFAADHVLWGTDSVWWGSPQWQIEAFRRMEMPESLMKRFGYAPLTVEVKRKIFGLNAARIYNVDPKVRRNPIPGDYVDRLRELYKQSGEAVPSNTQYGWVRV